MTAQISDSLFYRDERYSIAGLNGDGLFDPAHIGLKTRMISTACRRGFVCDYSLRDRRLILTRLTVGFRPEDLQRAERGDGPVLFGLTPKRDECKCWDCCTEEDSTYWSDFYYDGLSIPLKYTGGVLIGADFIDEMYIHMGFHPAYKYSRVHELLFESGQLVKASDLTSEMAKFREDIANRPLQPTDPTNKREIMEWIDRAFSLKYTR